MASKKRVRSHDSSSSNWSTGSADKESKFSDHMHCQSTDSLSASAINGTVDVTDDTSDGRMASEQELFIQAFEKPTQIYRYLRTRQLISPIFLTRTLSYMRHRLNRSNPKRRRDFSIDSLLQYVVDKKEREAIAEESSGNLSLSYLCIKNQSSTKDLTMSLETSILKMGHQKRKDVLAPIYQFKVGISEIVVNTEDMEPISLVVNKNELNETNGHIVKQWSYHLLFIASFAKTPSNNHLNGDCMGSDGQFINDFNDENSRSEAPVKRRRLDEPEELSYFKAELKIYDRHKHCLLTEGEYTVVLQPCAPPKISNRSYKPNKFSSWQQIDAQDIENLSIDDPNKQYGSMEVFRKGPILKFHLSWSARPVANGFIPVLSNDNENDSGIGNAMSDNSSQLSYNGLISANSPFKNQILNNLQSLTGKRSTRVTYQFLFNNNTRQQTKPSNDLCCPWCSLNCQKLYSLIKHLKLCHNRFNFTYSQDTHMRCARIDVAINEAYDGSYSGNPQDLSSCNTGYAFSRNGPVQRNRVTNVIVCRPKRFAHSMTEFDEQDDEEGLNGRIHITGHNRLYYHTNSCLPIRTQEMDYDSEGENDSEWLREKTQLMIDEFTDVNEGEKEVMKMWNLHVMKNGFVGDCQIHLACLMFIEEKGAELVRKNLYKNFILHLNNLYDFGLLNAQTFHDIVRKLSNDKSPQRRYSFAQSNAF